MKVRFTKSVESLNEHTRQLPKLSAGDSVLVQNQTGPHPSKWVRSGIVVECKDFDQYIIKIHGTGRLTLRDRKFLQKYTLPDPPCTYSVGKFCLADHNFPPQHQDMERSRPSSQPLISNEPPKN